MPRPPKAWATADALRKQLEAVGWLIKDSKEGFTVVAKRGVAPFANAQKCSPAQVSLNACAIGSRAAPERGQKPAEHAQRNRNSTACVNSAGSDSKPEGDLAEGRPIQGRGR